MDRLTCRLLACKADLDRTIGRKTIPRLHNQQYPSQHCRQQQKICNYWGLPVTKPHGTVWKVDELSHGSTFGKIVVVHICGVCRFRSNSHTSRVGGVRGDVETDSSIRGLVERRIASSAEEQGWSVVVIRGEGKHDSRCGGWVNPSGIRHVW